MKIFPLQARQCNLRVIVYCSVINAELDRLGVIKKVIEPRQIRLVAC